MSKVTYQIVKQIRHSQRVFKGSDGRFYLADESGDGRGTIGRPNETEDGPLALVESEPIVCRWDKGMGTSFSVTVDCERTGDRNTVGLTGTGALWLAAHLGLAITTREGDFRINPLPKETS
jgi:hypothetical protein